MVYLATGWGCMDTNKNFIRHIRERQGGCDLVESGVVPILVNLLNFQWGCWCLEMGHGLYPASAVGSHRILRRFLSGIMFIFVVLAKTDSLNDIAYLLLVELVCPQWGASSTQDEVLTDAWLAVLCLSDGGNDKIRAVIDTGVFPRLMELPV